MRFLAPFAWLSLMHIARGGELDEFSTDRARRARDLPTFNGTGTHNNIFDSKLSFDSGLSESSTGDTVLLQAFRVVDTNNDGRISYDELVSGMLFTWGNQERLENALQSFGLPTMREFMAEFDLDQDGYLDTAELRNILRPSVVPDKYTGHCPSLRSKLESCPTHLVLRCADYFRAAEGLCYSGHSNHIETCIMTESCENMCQCISNVEAAVAGNAIMVLQGPDGISVTYNPNQPEKRFLALLFFLLGGLTALEWGALALAAVAVAIGSFNVPQSRWMDFKFWDGSGNPPPCTIYVSYGHCGAILSSTARNCPNGGTRVYGNSCKDHFRYGSRGCGFLGLGCQSLCYNINESGCPCSMFTWKELDDVNLPGNDIRSMHVDLTSDCRNACAADTTCIAFTILPPTGQQTQINCFLKKAPMPSFSMETDVTSFIKLGSDPSSVCSQTLTTAGPFDFDFNPTTTSRRSLLDDIEGLITTQPIDLLSKRGLHQDRAFPFNDNAILVAAFLRFMYVGVQRFITQERTTITYQRLGNEIGARTMQSTVAGQIPLTLNAAPRWTGSEITYRLIELVRTMMQVTTVPPANPITAYQTAAVDNSPLGQALFPPAVTSLLTANENLIQTGQSSTWLGRNTPARASTFASTFPGVQVGFDSRLAYFQRGNAGPFSLEAAFLLAAQAAGVNWNVVRRTGANRNPQIRQVWFTGVIQPTLGVGDGECLTDENVRGIGYTQRVPGRTDNAPRAGVYFAIDLDPDLAPDDPNHNVFLFVVHTSDRASVVHVPNAGNLLNVGMTRYTPEQNDQTALFHLPSGATTNIEPGQPGNPLPTTLATRAFAHGHATMMNYQEFTSWVQQGRTQTPSTFPGYTPFGFLHLYILGEDSDPLFPRLDFLNR